MLSMIYGSNINKKRNLDSRFSNRILVNGP